MNYKIHQEQHFKYIDEGSGEVLLLLHGLFGALSNWEGFIEGFKSKYRVIIPMLPIYELPAKEASLEKMVEFVEEFVTTKNLENLTLIGNSLGGHIAILYYFKNPEQVQRLILTGSSGLFENSMGGSYPKRGSYEFIAERVTYTFYDPKIASKALIDEVFETTTNIPKCLCMVAMAKSAQRNNVAKDLHKIMIPTLLIWGLNDTITPPQVAHDFNRLIPGSELRFIDKCCHAPMMERPHKFNEIVATYLEKYPIFEDILG